MPFESAILKALPYSFLQWLASKGAAFVARMRRIRVEVHVAYFAGNPRPQVFINVVNRWFHDVEIIRVWFATSSPIEVINPDRPLPQRLRPWESWKTCADLESLPTRRVHDLVRVQLSSEDIYRSIAARRGVPTSGVVPGGR